MTEQFFDPQMVVFGKLALAAFLGLLIGTERAVAGKRAGSRTFALVALGSCLFIIISTNVTSTYLGLVNFDPMRVTAAIVTGIGFIGAGLIVFREHLLRGLTTAAALWVAAAIGVAVGYGMYAISIFTTIVVLLIFTVIWFVEHYLKNVFTRLKNGDTTDDETDE